MDCDESGSDVEEPSQILYDIVPYKEWEQEPEVIKYPDKQSTKGSRFWPFASTPSSPLPPNTERILSQRLAWSFAVSQDATLVAVLMESSVAVWHSKDSYGTLLGKRNLGSHRKDPAPAWRNIVWSDDAQMLALTFSDGAVEVCDTVGGLFYSIISPKIPSSQPGFVSNANRKGPTELSYLAVFFTKSRLRDKKWMSELVLVDIGGNINSFLVSASGYQELSSYSVGWNLTSAVYCPTHNLLLTAGKSPLSGRTGLVGRPSHSGLVSYRLVNDEPHYIPVLDDEENAALTARSFSIPFFSSQQEDNIIRMSVSENGRRLGAVHESGTISVWLLPGLMLGSVTKLSEQPGHDEVNPALLQAPNRKKIKAEFMANPVRFHPSDISWWDEESLIISRVSGALSVLRMENLANLLGDSPEFLDGVPRISQSFEKGFFALECESVVKGRRPSHLDDSMGEDPVQDTATGTESDDEDDDSSSWLGLGKRSASSLAYFLTDNERFAPPKKRSKLVVRTYRMLALVSTNPEELYARKIDAEEYGEAIMLAQHYRLDTDPVYERQWRKSVKSVAAIHDYLGKIKRRTAVLKECLDTIPSDIDAARELLTYGLSGTDLQALISMEKEDSGEFYHCSEAVVDDWFEEEAEDPEEMAAKKKEREKVEKNRLISKVNWQTLSLVQKDLIGSRLKFLYYLDILDTYEEALGGGQFAADRFEPDLFRRMRALSPLENCLYSARNSDPLTVSAFFSGVYSSIILPHWLPILSAFPETTKPQMIQDIMPGLGMAGEALPWLLAQVRDPDWAEQPLATKWSGHRIEFESSVLYSEKPELHRFKADHLTPALIKDWYEYRARQVAQTTSLPELALELLQQGLEHGVYVSLSLLNSLRTLDALVYDVQLDIDLDTFEKMDTMGQMECFVGESSDILHDIRSLLVPFLQRLDDAEPGQFFTVLYEFCIHKARSDLTIPLAVVENSGPKVHGPVVASVRDAVKIAIDSCYAFEGGCQPELVERMCHCVADFFELAPGRLRHDFITAHGLDIEQFKRFIQHTDIGRIIARHRVIKPLSLFKDNLRNRSAMQKIFESMTCHAEAMKPRLDQDGWRSVLSDLQRLQRLIPVVPIEAVYSMYCESLLSSGCSENIYLAGEAMRSMMEPEEQVRLVHTAWTHYFSTSANLNDPNIELASQCLKLVKGNHKEISDCSDLVASLKSLADFGLADVHPVQILNCKNRLDFVVHAIEARPLAYKNSQRLMKLATLLKAEAIDNLPGLVWTLVARKALEVRDFVACHTACNNIIKCGYTAGWDVCYALGVQADFNDLEKCDDLLSFALTHCEPDNIENILLSKLKVEQKLLHTTISGQVNISQDSVFERSEQAASTGDDAETKSTDDKFEDTFEELRPRSPFASLTMSPFASIIASSPYTSVTSVKNTLLNVTRLSTAYLVDNEVSRSVLNHTTSWVKEMAASHKSIGTTLDLEEADNFESIRFPAFYGSLFMDKKNDFGESQLDPSYTKYSMPRIESSLAAATQQALRSQLLSGVLLDSFAAENETGAEERRIPLDLLKELVPFVASQDVFQGIGLLLSLLDDSEAGREMLRNLPTTVPGINFIITFLAIRLQDQTEQGRERDRLFEATPNNLLASVIRSQEESADITEADRSLLSEMLELAADHRQAGVLSSLAGDVDLARFSIDQQYKEDTILGLARYLDDSNWKFTSTLAARNKVEPWILAATHAEAIFVDSPNLETAQEMLEERQLVQTLAQDPQRWVDWSSEKVLPLLDGTNYAMLTFYFDTNHQITGLNQFTQLKESVEHLASSRVAVDFLRLLNGDYSILDSIHSGNVEILAGAAEKMPESDTSLNAAQIYLRFAENEFFRRGTTSSNWPEAFSNCQTILEHLDPHRFVNFVKSCILTNRALANLPRAARNRILKKSIKFVEIKIAAKSQGDWRTTESWLKSLKVHLELFSSPLTDSVRVSMAAQDTENMEGDWEVGDIDSCGDGKEVEARFDDLLNRLELSGGDEKRILDLFAEIISLDEDEQLIRNLLVVWRQDRELVNEGLTAILRHCVQFIQSADCWPSLKPHDYTLCIQRLIKELKVETGGASLRSALTPLCTLEKLAVSDRLILVQLIQQFGQRDTRMEEDEDLEEQEIFDGSFLSELYLVQERLQAIVPDQAVCEQDLASAESKLGLFKRVAEACSDVDSLTQLVAYAREYFAGDRSLEACLERCLMCSIKTSDDEQKVLNLALDIGDQLQGKTRLNFLKQVREWSNELCAQLIMKWPDNDHISDVAPLLLDEDADQISDLTFQYIIENHIAYMFVETHLYQRMVEAAISCDLGPELVKQLRASDHEALAMALQLSISGLPESLVTMAAFGIQGGNI